MSDSNRVSVALKAEVTPGVAPAGPYQAINVSSVSLASQKNTVEENTIRNDRNLRGLIMTSLLPQGGFGFDYIFGNLNSVLPGIMGLSALPSAFSLTNEVVDIASGVITANAGTPFSTLVAGQWVQIYISTTRYFCKITTVGGAGASITVTGNVPPDATDVTLASVKGQMLRNGTVMTTYTVEQAFADLATDGFFAHRGMVPNTFSLNAQAETIVSGDLQFMGMEVDAPTDVSVSGGAYDAAVSAESFAGLRGNFGLFEVGGSIITASSMAVRGVNFSVNNNVRRDAAINVANMGWGQFTVTGQLSTFLKAGTSAVDAFYTHANDSVSYAMSDAAGNTIILTFLRIKYGNFTKQVGGKNQAVMGDFDFTAILHPTYNATLQIDIFSAS